MDKENETSTINHFYEKLLKLRDLMKTKTGKEMAETRHQFMIGFLDQISEEYSCQI
jgi:uncharacterized protein